jgi:hypothetical protein
MKTELILGRIETPNFEFLTIASNEKTARALLAKAWSAHLDGFEGWSFKELEDGGSVWFEAYLLNETVTKR